MILLRGVSGSGKSTRAELLKDQLKFHTGIDAVVCSADSFRHTGPNGEYVFDASMNGVVHAMAQEKAKKAIEDNKHVISDNTNTLQWEMDKYIKMAKEAGYEIYQCFSHGMLDKDDIDLYTERNLHHVPREAIVKQYRKLLKDKQFGSSVGELIPLK
jgi:predicted kinase